MKYSTSELLPMVEQEAQNQGVDPDTAKAIFLSENSGFDRGGNLVTRGSVDTNTTSPANARGLMQVMDSTASSLRRLGLLPADTDLTSAQGQIQAGVAAIKELNNRGITNPSEVAVGYNGSPAVLNQFRNGQQMNPETTDYLKKFSQHYTGSAVPMDYPQPDAPTVNLATGNVQPPSPGSGGYTMQRLSSSTSQKTLPPGAAEELQAKQRSFSALSTDTVAQLNDLTQQMLGQVPSFAAAATAEGQAKAEQATTTAQKELITNQSQNQIASAFGVNLNTDPDSVIGRNMAIVSSSREQRMDLQDQIAQLRSTGGSPLTDPVGWLVNSVKSLPLIAQHNALVTQETNAANNISLAQKLAQQQTTVQPAALGEAINAQGMANAKVAMADAEMKKNAIIQSARSNAAQFLSEAQRASGTDLAHLVTVDDLLGTHTTTVAAVSERDKAEDDQMAPIKLAADRLGLDPNLITKTAFKSLSPSTQATWAKMGSFGRLGVSPGDAIATLYDTFGNGVTAMNKNAPAAGNFVSGVVQQGQSALSLLRQNALTNPGLATEMKQLKNPTDQLAFGIDNWVQQQEVAADPKTKDFSNLAPTNPYKLNYGYAAAQPELADNPIAKIVQGLPKGVQANEQLLLSSAVSDINNPTNPKPVGQAAQELYDFYHTGMANQVRDTRMESVGFKPRDSYPVMTKVSSMMNQPVDLMNRTSIENFLTSQAASARLRPPMMETMFPSNWAGSSAPMVP